MRRDGIRKREVAGRRKRRLSQRLVAWAQRLAVGSLLLFLLGIGGLFWASGEARWLSLAFALVGLVGITLQVRVLLRAQAARVQLQRAAERRLALQANRRERADRERLRRQAEQETRLYAAERLEQARRARKEEATRLAQKQAEQRNARSRYVEREATRMASLSDVELHAEVASLMAERGYRPEPADSEYAGDLLLRGEGGLEVLRCVPIEKKAGGSDVEELEAWRRQAEAARGYLIATAGFLPSAVEHLAGKPLTLVEPHLLAHWSQEARRGAAQE